MSSAEAAVALPDMPYNVTPVVLGEPNGDDPRLVVFNFYLYAEGIYKGNEAWVTGVRVDAYLEGGQLTEILSKNSKHLVGHASVEEPVAAADAAGDEDEDEDDPADALFVEGDRDVTDFGNR